MVPLLRAAGGGIRGASCFGAWRLWLGGGCPADGKHRIRFITDRGCGPGFHPKILPDAARRRCMHEDLKAAAGSRRLSVQAASGVGARLAARSVPAPHEQQAEGQAQPGPLLGCPCSQPVYARGSLRAACASSPRRRPCMRAAIGSAPADAVELAVPSCPGFWARCLCMAECGNYLFAFVSPRKGNSTACTRLTLPAP